jgi:thiamine pyrophosphokinase
MEKKLQEFALKIKTFRQLYLIGPLLKSAPQWQEAPYIFVDGGHRWRSLQKKSDLSYSLGDGDSGERESLDTVVSPYKDYSDLQLALDTVTDQQWDIIHLLGFLGGHRDHELINIGEVSHFLKGQKNCLVHFEDAVTLAAPGKYQLSHRGRFSIITFDQSPIMLTGNVRYPIENKMSLRPLSSHGLSNLSDGQFELENEAICAIYWTHPLRRDLQQIELPQGE